VADLAACWPVVKAANRVPRRLGFPLAPFGNGWTAQLRALGDRGRRSGRTASNFQTLQKPPKCGGRPDLLPALPQLCQPRQSVEPFNMIEREAG
jgi:hypothetical protein